MRIININKAFEINNILVEKQRSLKTSRWNYASKIL